MAEQKQPQAGEWWQQLDGKKYLCIAANKQGETAWQVKDGSFRLLHGDSYWKYWQHLPDCDSWTWQPAADLPPVESPDEYRILREDEQTVATDERMYPDGYRTWTAMTAMDGWESGMTVKELRAKFVSWNSVVVRRKVVPPQPQPKRVPVRLWVSHRLESEHGDWPMRCTPASEEFDDGGRSPWLEIRHDGHKFYIEAKQ